MAVKRKRRVAKRKVARKRKPLSASVMATLKRKAKGSRYTYGQLASVFRRGQGAFLSSGSRRGVSMNQWAFGRVNSFMRGGHSQDNDIKRRTRKRRVTKKKR
tara:strand:- start:211 stop:516 length:306 start_codon:yes stop_codon:yes gene_type:complete